jgi:predicted ribosomally synthesized peptide with nif11-like leader
MSVQATTAFWERIQSDEQFRNQVERAATPEEKHRVVAAAGYDVEPGDLVTLRSLAGLTEISDEDLEKVAGGSGTATGEMGVLVTVGSVVGAAAAAALV